MPLLYLYNDPLVAYGVCTFLHFGVPSLIPSKNMAFLQTFLQQCNLWWAYQVVLYKYGEGELSRVVMLFSNLLIWQDKHTLISIFFLIFSMLVQKQKHSPNYEFCVNFFKLPFPCPPPHPFLLLILSQIRTYEYVFLLVWFCVLPISCWWTFTFIFCPGTVNGLIF